MIRSTIRTPFAALAWLNLTWVGCAGSIASLPVRFDPVCVPCDHPACDNPLELQYLGSGGFLMKRGSDEIATGPFFSNPSVLETGLCSIEADIDAIDEFMPSRPNLSAILVGHAHYDHLMDIPEIVKSKTPNATIYASKSARFSLASVNPPLAFETVDDRGWSQGEAQQWIDLPGTNIRFLAIKSKHAPHLMGITLMKGSFDQSQTELPKRALQWLEGQTHSFLIEFRDASGNPEFRLHYQDTSTDGDVGRPPEVLDNGTGPVPYTILIPTVASWKQVDDYPEALLDRVQPDYAVLGHWEDFFRPFTRDEDELRSVRGTNAEPFVKKMEDTLGESAVALPAPLTRIRFARECP